MAHHPVSPFLNKDSKRSIPFSLPSPVGTIQHVEICWKKTINVFHFSLIFDYRCKFSSIQSLELILSLLPFTFHTHWSSLGKMKGLRNLRTNNCNLCLSDLEHSSIQRIFFPFYPYKVCLFLPRALH